MSGLADAPAPDFATELVRRATDGGADAAQVTAVDVDRFEIDFSERKVDLLRSTANRRRRSSFCAAASAAARP